MPCAASDVMRDVAVPPVQRAGIVVGPRSSRAEKRRQRKRRVNEPMLLSGKHDAVREKDGPEHRRVNEPMAFSGKNDAVREKDGPEHGKIAIHRADALHMRGQMHVDGAGGHEQPSTPTTGVFQSDGRESGPKATEAEASIPLSGLQPPSFNTGECVTGRYR
mmetsp:Transcript_32710/g.59939  ORF Transcript_32710/g.59939 Transcript_32710/m.59939 type:complete len:162 (+) Transcript_32710:289-774(+)